MKWTYLDDYGRRYNVGLYHGSETGHLLIHCNGRVVVIDFNVLSTKKYSFLINDELCDVHVEQKDGRFAYGLEIDRKANTPGNRRRRKQERSNIVKGVLMVAAFLLVVAASAFFMLMGKGYF